MPANLSPDYYRAENEYRQALTPQDKLEALRAMLAAIPKHKGTEKMQADLKKRISSLKNELQKSGRKKGFSIKVEKEGGAQIVLVGPPNSGKSQLVSRLTNTELEIAPYPYTTREPHPVIMSYDNYLLELVDLPPVCSQHMEFWVPDIIKHSDFVLVVVDISDPDVMDSLEDTLQTLANAHIKLAKIQHQPEYQDRMFIKQSWLACCKTDITGAMENYKILKELYAEQFNTSALDCLKQNSDLDFFKKQLIAALQLIRVYTKPPGKQPDNDKPYMLKRGSTLDDLAQMVHKDFSEHLKFAKLWGHGKFEGQKINRDYTLADNDIVEFHI